MRYMVHYTKNILHTRHEKVAKVFLLLFLISITYGAVGAADTLQNEKKGHKEDEVQKIKGEKSRKKFHQSIAQASTLKNE